MFAHGRPDIMPGLDLGLVIAAQHLKKLRKRPDAKAAAQNRRGVAALAQCRGAAALALSPQHAGLEREGPKTKRQ